MWVSPDGKIHKLVIKDGIWGKKPSEETECEISISDCPDSLLQYNNILVIGDSDDDFRRALDICLTYMNEQEIAKVKILPENVSFTINLVRIQFHGYIYEWNAKKKLEISQKHKDRGVVLYKQNRYKDAAYRFIKSLKIIHSIPINAESPPEEIDGVPISEINNMKANLYNNLASFYLKKEAWALTIDSCKKVFDYDRDSVKAHYKLAVAYLNDRNWELAEKELNIVLTIEPDNKAAAEHIKHVKDKIHKTNIEINKMVKKMFK